MSLIGSLEDLNLGDILQIISLSQKSGVLVIQTDDGEGRIAFRGGLVRGASVKGGPGDLREVLVDGSFVSADEYDAAVEDGLSRRISIEDALSERTSITTDRIDSLRRESVEAAVVSMFQWRKGEFSFDVRVEAEPGDPPLFLPTGLNAQYLAMEGARVDDEFERVDGESECGAGEPPASGGAGASDEVFDPETSFASVSLEVDHGSHSESECLAHEARPAHAAMEALVQVTAERLEADRPEEERGEVLPAAPVEEVSEVQPDGEQAIEKCDLIAPVVLESEVGPSEPDPELDPELLDAEEEVEAGDELVPIAELEEDATPAAPTEAAMAPADDGPPLVVIDSDLVALEWIKSVLGSSFARIHIFQRSELGLSRIRQYLARAELPVLLVAPDSPGDPLSGIRDTHDFVRRLKRQQHRIPVLWLMQEGAEPLDRIAGADGVITRPSSQQIRARGAEGQLEERAASFCLEIGELISRGVSEREATVGRARHSGNESSQGLGRLKEATAALSDASTRGEVLPLVIRFAAETFSRVAMFMVRGDEILGMAQSGLDRAGGPDDAGLRELGVSRHECGWFRTVLEHRSPVRSGASGRGDLQLASYLGDAVPEEVYVAPIESSGHVVALLYADNLPEGDPLGDSQALDVVLQHAGLALERAVLERTLAEIEGDTDSGA